MNATLHGDFTLCMFSALRIPRWSLVAERPYDCEEALAQGGPPLLKLTVRVMRSQEHMGTECEYTCGVFLKNIQGRSILTRFQAMPKVDQTISPRISNGFKEDEYIRSHSFIESAEARTMDLIPKMCPVDSRTRIVRCKTNT